MAALLAELPAGSRRGGVRVSAGEDDCAVVRAPGRGHWQLLKTDCVIEGVHFTPGTDPGRVGWKALCRPLSDIAASGGTPDHALVTFALSAAAAPDWAREVYAGIGRAAREFGVAVVGGDTASTPGPSFLSVCLTGRVARGRCVTRAGGRPGDALFVTGNLGGSFDNGRHLDFRPRLEEARWLVERFRIRAMMDLSDGLAADLPRMARAGGTGFVVDPARLPLSPGGTIRNALSDGEDYELLFAISPSKAERLTEAWEKRFSLLPLTRIGILAEPGVREGLGSAGGFDHFTARPA